MQPKQLLIAIDQLFNVLLGGMADETVSARAYRNRRTWRLRMRFINWLFNDPMHCEDSYMSEVNNKQLPEEYSKPIIPSVEYCRNDNGNVFGAIIGVVLFILAIGYLTTM